jgi:hypothetical protein
MIVKARIMIEFCGRVSISVVLRRKLHLQAKPAMFSPDFHYNPFPFYFFFFSHEKVTVQRLATQNGTATEITCPRHLINGVTHAETPDVQHLECWPAVIIFENMTLITIYSLNACQVTSPDLYLLRTSAK